MSIKLEVVGRLGKDPYVQETKNGKATILSLAARRGSLQPAVWITGSIWEVRLGAFVLEKFKKGDLIQAFGTLSNLMVYFGSDGQPKPGLDFIINAVGFAEQQKEK